MTQLPPYQGDATFHALLTQAKCPLSLAEVRALIMRDMWSLDTVQPMMTMQEALGGRPAEVFTDPELAKDFMLQFIGLWGTLVPHLDEANPFRLYPIPGLTREALQLRHQTRVAEIRWLMGIFDFDKEAHRELADLTEPSETVLEQVLATLDVPVPDSETATEADARQFEDALSSMEAAVENLFNQVGRKIVSDRQKRQTRERENRNTSE